MKKEYRNQVQSVFEILLNALWWWFEWPSNTLLVCTHSVGHKAVPKMGLQLMGRYHSLVCRVQ